MPESPFIAIDHVQLAMPLGEEQQARAFYGGLLGMTELTRPPELAKRGGAGLRAAECNSILEWRATSGPRRRRTRPCAAVIMRFSCNDCETGGLRVTEPQDIPEVSRCHVHDPFGNRLELIRA